MSNAKRVYPELDDATIARWEEWPHEPVERDGPDDWELLGVVVRTPEMSDQQTIAEIEREASSAQCHPCNIGVSESPDPAWEAAKGRKSPA